VRYERRCVQEDTETTLNLMQNTNPVIIPRNHIVEKSLIEAENGDLSLFNEFLSALQTPYSPVLASERFTHPPAPSNKVYQTFCGT